MSCACKAGDMNVFSGLMKKAQDAGLLLTTHIAEVRVNSFDWGLFSHAARRRSGTRCKTPPKYFHGTLSVWDMQHTWILKRFLKFLEKK